MHRFIHALIVAVVSYAGVAFADNYAMQFDGVSNRIEFIDSALRFPTNAITVEFWMKTSATTNAGTPVSYAVSNNDNELFIFDDRDFQCAIKGNRTALAGISATNGVWHHMALTWTNSGALRFYKDGVAVITTNNFVTNLQLTRGGTLEIGQEQDVVGGNFQLFQAYSGLLDELRIWRVVRSQSEIATNRFRSLTGGEAGLIGYYRMNEGSGTASQNFGQSFYNGNVIGATWAAPGVPLQPEVLTLNPENITATGVVLNGGLTGHAQTQVRFAWGNGLTLDQFTPWQTISNTGPAQFAAPLSGVVPGTYRFRAEASNEVGTAVGDEISFNTVLPDVSGQYTNLRSGQWIDFDNDGRLDIFSGSAVSLNTVSNVFVDEFFNSYGFVQAVGDINNDGRIDVVEADEYPDQDDNFFCHIMQNVGGFPTETFVFPLGKLEARTLAVMDVNHDGLQDIIVTGNESSAPLGVAVKVFINQSGPAGLNFLEIGAAGIGPVSHASLFPGDFDNDGYTDLLITGEDPNNAFNPATKLYRNNRSGTFVPVAAGLPNIEARTVQWIDYNNDGNLDLFLSGETNSFSSFAIVNLFRNNGDGTFTDAAAGFPALYYPVASWGDFDGDGWPDLALSGQESPNFLQMPLVAIYRNNSGSSFTSTNPLLPQVLADDLAWGDSDRDNRMDLLGDGADTNGYFHLFLLHNNVAVPNSPPTTPGGLSTTISNSLVTFRWNAASDSQTPTAGVTYNLRVGVTPGGREILSPLALGNGTVLMDVPGNAGSQRSFTLSLLPGRNYYWSVQAVDSDFGGSPFAAEQSFSLHSVIAPVSTLPVLGDLNGDGVVDLNELNQVIQNYRNLHP